MAGHGKSRTFPATPPEADQTRPKAKKRPQPNSCCQWHGHKQVTALNGPAIDASRQEVRLKAFKPCPCRPCHPVRSIKVTSNQACLASLQPISPACRLAYLQACGQTYLQPDIPACTVCRPQALMYSYIHGFMH